ncbi:hypothetical protein BpHYR1_053772 [Brachionus plicatilis]|uniref:Uncharacterized protein n=1 Tax=Brachionus plicatilis TaxID=10195 RepID=A0A3M7RPS5_BRAPC|nr:hypothetical protein BpHYR1_053772 [Brachionus plicatilis]
MIKSHRLSMSRLFQKRFYFLAFFAFKLFAAFSQASLNFSEIDIQSEFSDLTYNSNNLNIHNLYFSLNYNLKDIEDASYIYLNFEKQCSS